MLLGLMAVCPFVSDIDRAREFYAEKLGLQLTMDEPDYLILDVGGPMLIVEALDPDDPEAAELVGRFAGISFKVDDIGATYTALSAKGVEFTAPPETQPWGGTLAHLSDPDGNELTLVE